MRQSSTQTPSMAKISAMMLFNGLCATSGSVVLPFLQQKYALTYDFSGLLLALLSAGNLLAALVNGFGPRMWGQRKTALTFSVGLLLGYLALALPGTPLLLAFAFFAIGIGKGSFLNNVTVLAGKAGGDRARNVSLINALFAAGALCAPLLYLVLRRSTWWQLPFLALAVAGAAAWLILCRAGLESGKAAACAAYDLQFLKEKHFWFSAGFLFCQQCAEISVTGWLVTYFKDSGILTGVFSELTVTVVWLAMLVGRLGISFVLPANSRLRSLVLISLASFITYLLLLGCNSGLVALVCLFLFGLSICGAYPVVIAQASRSVSNASMGVLLPIGAIGAIAMPSITGIVAQRTSLRGGMLCSAVALGLMLVFALLLRHSEHVAAKAA